MATFASGISLGLLLNAECLELRERDLLSSSLAPLPRQFASVLWSKHSDLLSAGGCIVPEQRLDTSIFLWYSSVHNKNVRTSWALFKYLAAWKCFFLLLFCHSYCGLQETPQNMSTPGDWQLVLLVQRGDWLVLLRYIWVASWNVFPLISAEVVGCEDNSLMNSNLEQWLFFQGFWKTHYHKFWYTILIFRKLFVRLVFWGFWFLYSDRYEVFAFFKIQPPS